VRLGPSWVQEVCRPEGDEIRSDPPSTSPSGGRRRRLETGPRGSGRDVTPSPRNHHCRRRRHHHHWGILPQAPPSAWIWPDAPLTLDGRGSSSSPPSWQSPWRTLAFRQIGAVYHGRPRPPLPEASRTGRRSVPVKIKADLEKKGRGEEKEPGIEVARKKKTYQIYRAGVWPHGEAVNMLRLKIAGNCSPDSGRDFVIRRSFV
jgi:hypothetical protein